MIQIRWAAALLPVVIVPLLQAVSEPLRLDEMAIVRFIEAAPNQTLIKHAPWLAYGRLGSEAVTSFAADPEATHDGVKDRDYLGIAPALSPKLAHGRMANLLEMYAVPE